MINVYASKSKNNIFTDFTIVEIGLNILLAAKI